MVERWQKNNNSNDLGHYPDRDPRKSDFWGDPKRGYRFRDVDWDTWRLITSRQIVQFQVSIARWIGRELNYRYHEFRSPRVIIVAAKSCRMRLLPPKSGIFLVFGHVWANLSQIWLKNFINILFGCQNIQKMLGSLKLVTAMTARSRKHPNMAKLASFPYLGITIMTQLVFWAFL